MKTKMKLLFLAVLCISVSAQDGEKIRPFQFSLITPLGTNGIQSQSIANVFSLNLLGGYSRGNTGFELGGMYNINFGFTRGFQFGGLFNYSGSSERAFQIAGIANINRRQAGASSLPVW
ncbi:hypothetical protein K7I13_07420 [Brucepastera parasyntrophica]|uniref:hypothetical protein n=1 Tax=Brucepastera parasyntrophica TaxID=2880008 RepID=UPI0021086089|nr:hypothetical protein [Brucepastera parasyntrophica]ULQ61073.1 hypothetical protein K7I13_07420 [Brucepastera parasyntrophica]